MILSNMNNCGIIIIIIYKNYCVIFLMLCGLVFIRINFFKAKFVPRRCNIVADRLVALTNIWDNQIRIDEPPICILDVLAREAVS